MEERNIQNLYYMDPRFFKVYSQYRTTIHNEIKSLYELAKDENAEAMLILADHFISGKGVESNPVKSLFWASQSAQHGNKEALEFVSHLLIFNDEVKDPEKGYELASRLYESDSSYGALLLGFCYKLGIGTAQDDKKAAEMFLNAAKSGDPQGMLYYAILLETGEGVDKNISLALEYYHKAADLNNSDAQCNLGYLYFIGEEVPQNFSEAFYWLNRSAQNRNPRALAVLGDCFTTGAGIDADLTRAFQCYYEAADLGYTCANRFGNVLYERYRSRKK